jgi:hypothetical protein
MVRRKECIGFALCAFGCGVLLASFFDSVLCPLLLGLGCVLAGLLFAK